MGFFLVPGCGPSEVRDHSPLDNCFPCENIQGELVWDADGDDLDDFVFYQTGLSPAVIGSVGTYYRTTLGFIEKSETTSLLYPVEKGMWISRHTVWNEYRTIGLGNLKCASREPGAPPSESNKEWHGPFTGPDGDIFAFRLDTEEGNLVGVAKIRLSPCDGWVDILSVRTELESYGLFVGEEPETDIP